MSFSANIPALGNKIVKDVPDQNALNQRMMRCDFSDVVDLPVGTKALVESAEGWEVRQFNGTGWVLLERWNIDAQKVDGHSVSTGTTAKTIPVRDADGKLPGDITGNAATAAKAKALSNTNPVAMGGTGATTAEQARANLGTPPKSHAASSTEYGAGTSTLYGHLKSHDEPDSTLTAASGHAFSPAGAAAMQEALGSLLGETQGAVSELGTSLRALIADAQSSADDANAGLVGVVRSVNGKAADTSGNVAISTAPTAGTGISVSGQKVSLKTVVTAGNAGPTANASPAHGGTFTVPYFTYDAYGRVTGSTNRTITLPAAPTSVSTATKTTTVPNFAVAAANGKKCSGGSISGNNWVLPSGGTWRYIKLYGVGTSNGAAQCGTVAGGSSLPLVETEGGANGNDYTYNYIAIRIS